MALIVRLALVLVALGLGGCARNSSNVQKSDHSELNYVVSPLFATTGGKSELRLAVDLYFRGAAEGTSTLVLPDHWAGQKHYEKAILGLEVLTPGATLVDTDFAANKMVTHKPNELLHVRYVIAQDWQGALDADEHYYRPVLDAKYFYFIGEGFWVEARAGSGGDDVERDISVRWKGFPTDWNLVNSFGASQPVQQIHHSFSVFKHAAYMGGDFRTTKFLVRDKPVYVATRGNDWKIGDHRFSEMLERIFLTERGFFNDYDFPYFLVVRLPIRKECCTLAGTGLTNSFSSFGSTDIDEEPLILHNLAHELFHTWNGRKIKRQDPEELVYWFSEGFTNYYTRVMNLRAGLITLPDYVASYNAAIVKYHASSARNARNEEVLKNFWNDRDVERMPYNKGDMLAHNWNFRIKEATHGRNSIDDVMRDLLHAAQTQHMVVSAGNINELVRHYWPHGILKDVRVHINNGETLSPHPQALGPCARLSLKKIETYSLGFDFKTSKVRHLVTGLDTHGNAYKAGLREGQKIRGWSFNGENTHRPAMIEIEDEQGRSREIRFLPVGKEQAIPQYALDEKRWAADPKTCLSWFGL